MQHIVPTSDPARTSAVMELTVYDGVYTSRLSHETLADLGRRWHGTSKALPVCDKMKACLPIVIGVAFFAVGSRRTSWILVWFSVPSDEPLH